MEDFNNIMEDFIIEMNKGALEIIKKREFKETYLNTEFKEEIENYVFEIRNHPLLNNYSKEQYKHLSYKVRKEFLERLNKIEEDLFKLDLFEKQNRLK